jgi:4-amino-4-deoxy-L-arabinose transferase-like glycosyltransferase
MASLASQLNHLPQALIPALRLLWSQTLFPAASATPEKTRAASWAVLLFLPALLLYPALGFHLFEPDEGRYAEIPREMLARGDWIVPTLQGEPYMDKPPLLYWLVMLSYKVFGVSVAAARLVPALTVHGCILATYLFGCHAFGERRGLRAALLLSVMPALIGIGRILTLDGLLTLWVTIGLFAGFRVATPVRPRGAVALWTIACGMGVLTKGPVALALVLVPLFAWRRLHPDRAAAWGRSTWAIFIAGVAAINVPWYVAMSLRQPGFVKYFFWQHNVQRFFTPFDHVEPIWYYGPILLVGLFPAVLALPAIVRHFAGPAGADRRSPELSFALVAGLGCVGFFSLSGCKLPTYILPAFPALALALSVLMESNPTELFSRRQWIVGLVWVPLVSAAVWFVLPAYAHARSPFRDAETVRKYCADPATRVVSYPRNVDSLSFYLGRDDLRSTRSKEVNQLIEECRRHPATVVLFTHRHSMQAFRYALPADLALEPVADFRRPSIFGDVPWGLCDMGIVRKR